MCAVTFGAPQTNVKRELENVLKQVTSALQHKDIDAFSASMAPDYTATDPSGKVMTRAQVVQSFSGLMNALHDIKWSRNVKKLTRRGRFMKLSPKAI